MLLVNCRIANFQFEHKVKNIEFSAPRPECTTDPECPDHLACIREKCQNPCFTTTCGVNAECRVQRHRAVCICRPGYEGDPYRICEERKIYPFCTPESEFYRFLSFLQCLAGCKSDDECPLTQACIQRECQDPCPYEQCGIKAFCTVNRHRAKCQCPPGHKGSPYVECRPYECLTDPECPTTLACRNEKCVDPCDCAANADCEARNHRGICTCRPGYTGDPYVEGCRPSKITIVREIKASFSIIPFSFKY